MKFTVKMNSNNDQVPLRVYLIIKIPGYLTVIATVKILNYLPTTDTLENSSL